MTAPLLWLALIKPRSGLQGWRSPGDASRIYLRQNVERRSVGVCMSARSVREGGNYNLTLISSDSLLTGGQLIHVSAPLNISDKARLQTRKSVQHERENPSL